MMNKKILLSVVAAATISSVFTGCGSSSSSSDDTTISGVAQKADLNGGDVTVGTNTIKTGVDGTYTITKGANDNRISIQNGTFKHTVDGQVGTYDNTQILMAVLDNNSAGNVAVNQLTTLVEIFRDAGVSDDMLIKAACKTLGVPYGLNKDLSDYDIGENEDEAFAMMAYIAQAQSAENSEVLKAFADVIYDAAEAAIESGDDININELVTILGDAQEAAEEKAAELGIEIDTYVEPTPTSTEALTDVVNLEGNSTSSTDDAAIEYTIDGGETWTGVTRTDSSLNANSSVVLEGDVKVQFELTDHTTSLETLGKGSLFIKYDGSDETNSNSSYRMALTGLDLATYTEGDDTYITLNHNASAKLTTTAYSTTNIAMSNVNVSADELCNMGLIAQGNGNESIVVNLSSFVGYMATTYEPHSDEHNGNFTSGMLNGEYSLRVYVNIDDQKMSRDDKKYSIISGTTYVGQDGLDGVGTTDATSYTGYKMLDTNLNY